MTKVIHWSDCAVNNEPALPAGPCNCGGYPYTAQDRVHELEAEIRIWAEYCRSAKPGPNIADVMLKFIGDLE